MRRCLWFALLLLPWTVADHVRAISSEPDDRLPKVLWHPPRSMSERDWICGPGGCDHIPAPPFHFLKEEPTGSNPKVSVKDVKGRTWSVKFGAEVIPECFAARFLEALGYVAESTYFVATGTIEGVGRLRRAARFIHEDGTFAKARFELRGQDDFVFLKGYTWSWVDNPFRGTHELAGLKILMMLLSNWDAKDARDGEEDSNNGVFRRLYSGRSELAYAVFDWGASLGEWGGRFRRDKSDCSGYLEDTPRFVEGVRQNQIQWGFTGKHAADLKDGISTEDVRWLTQILARVSPGQVRTGLKASGATERQSACWAWAIDNRIQQLRAIAGN